MDPAKVLEGHCGCGRPEVGVEDSDGDGLVDCVDNCHLIANPEQEDEDADSRGDACDLTMGPACVGDCDASVSVSGGEIRRAIPLLFDEVGLKACPQYDPDGDGRVRAAELLGAIVEVSACRFLVDPVQPAPVEVADLRVNPAQPGGAGAAVCHAKSGESIVVWRAGSLLGRRFDSDGNPSAGEFAVSQGFGASADVACLADGSFLVSWYADRVVHLRRFHPDGEPDGSAAPIDGIGQFVSPEPAIALSETETVRLFWRDWRPVGVGIRQDLFTQPFDRLGRPQREPVALKPVSGRGRSRNWGAVVEPDGGVAVVSGSGDRIWLERFDPRGRSKGPSVELTGEQPIDAIHPSIARNEDGSALVVWSEERAGGGAIVGRRLDRDFQVQDSEFQVGSSIRAFQSTPVTRSAGPDQFVVVWEAEGRSANDPFGRDIVARRVGTDGRFHGEDFVVNSTTIGDQGYPGLAADGSGVFTVVWEGIGPGGQGIFAKRFRGDGVPFPRPPLISD